VKDLGKKSFLVKVYRDLNVILRSLQQRAPVLSLQSVGFRYAHVCTRIPSALHESALYQSEHFIGRGISSHRLVLHFPLTRSTVLSV